MSGVVLARMRKDGRRTYSFRCKFGDASSRSPFFLRDSVSLSASVIGESFAS